MTALPLAFALSLAATDLTGTWTLKYEKDFSGHPGSRECTVQQDGEKLSGICGGEAKITGRVRNGKVTFEHQTGRNSEITVHYSAVLNKDGTAMKGTWQYLNPTEKKSRRGEFTFSRHQSGLSRNFVGEREHVRTQRWLSFDQSSHLNKRQPL